MKLDTSSTRTIEVILGLVKRNKLSPAQAKNLIMDLVSYNVFTEISLSNLPNYNNTSTITSNTYSTIISTIQGTNNNP